MQEKIISSTTSLLASMLPLLTNYKQLLFHVQCLQSYQSTCQKIPYSLEPATTIDFLLFGVQRAETCTSSKARSNVVNTKSKYKQETSKTYGQFFTSKQASS